VKRNSNGFIRAFDEEGNEIPVSRHSEKEREREAPRETLAAMEQDDLTQRSAMSLTQENPPSAYDQFNIQKHTRDDYISTATPEDGDAPESLRTQNEALRSREHASTKTESSAYTYEENDSKYIHLNLEPSSIVDADAEDDDGVSLDPSLVAPQPEQPQSFEPQTPAPPMNPFNRKGSVLKPSQMFGATQPSSVGRRASPTSTRPSPDLYNDFSSPPKRSRLLSSPLATRNGVDDDTSPLQSSVRDILARSNSALTEVSSATKLRASGVQSFDIGPRLQRSGAIHEPRPYLSMRESQERRNVFSASDTDSDSDSSIDARPRKRLERERRIRQELSTIGRMPTSSRPSSASAVEVPSTGRRQSWMDQCDSAANDVRNTQNGATSTLPGLTAVEVPSTGRRQSIQEDYITPCEGTDARDTFQGTQDPQDEDVKDTPPDDVVADSQVIPDRENPVECHPSSNSAPPPSAPETRQCSGPTTGSQQLAHHEQTASHPLFDNSHINQQMEQRHHKGAASASADSTSAPEPSLPLQEPSRNQNNLRTPVANKSQPFSDGPETVPETSPSERTLLEQRSLSEARLRPMGEIASISFGADGIDDLANVPGFSQDVDFENAMKIPSSPQPPARVLGQSTTPAPETIVNSKAVAIVGDAYTSFDREEDVHKAALLLDDTGNSGTSEQPEEILTTEQQIQQDNDNHQLYLNGEKAKVIQDVYDSTEHSLPPSSTIRTGLRSKSELKGPSRALRRSWSTSRSNNPSSKKPKTTKTVDSPLAKRVSISMPVDEASVPPVRKNGDTESTDPASAPAPSFTKSLKRKSGNAYKKSTPAPLPKRTSKRKSGTTIIDNSVVPTRSSKRQSIARDATEDNEDPLALPIPAATVAGMSPPESLFGNMAFAVSYQKREEEKDDVTKKIRDNGGKILEEGFDILFETSKTKELDAGLMLSAVNKPLGFSALIADEHSRKTKYMQALALGLPCISGQWISACVSKGAILDWSPYLLCAGQSSFLGNAMKSRVLPKYAATEANLESILEGRDKLLDGKSVLMVTSRGKADKRKPYMFLTRALGPSRVGQVSDLSEARTKLGSETWDFLYTDTPKEVAAATVFSSANSSNGSKKRKRGPTAMEDSTKSPKRVRVIDDETMIQSLILGQIMEV
jgi:BRCA1 C Terminus (BRCT) domain